MPHVYILRCSDNSYYVGSTWNLERRIAEHQLGEGAEYTKRRRPLDLVYAEEFDRISDAFEREKQVQNWSRRKREALIRGDFDALPAASARKTRRVRKTPVVEAAKPVSRPPRVRSRDFETGLRPPQSAVVEAERSDGLETTPAISRPDFVRLNQRWSRRSAATVSRPHP